MNIGDLAAGTHFLQILLEDHGGLNGNNVSITGDTFIPRQTDCTPSGVPEPATLALRGLGLVGLGLGLRRNR